MYKSFFGLKRNPFEISPDPYFVFPTEKYKEALASVYYAICRRKGFVVMTGEVGTGKTLMVRCLLELLKRQQVAFANVFNPRLSPIEFLRYVEFDLGIGVNAAECTKSSLLWQLYRFLLAQRQKGLTTVLVVDEAQQLSAQVLEEIRLLTNLETAQEKLLQIVLVGQPELEQKLDSFDLRQLKQRIAMRSRLEPLAEEETRSYIARRLKLAGADSRAETVFPPRTVEAIYRYSRGIPRLINTICDQGLVAAYARGEYSVGADTIEEIATHFRLQFASVPSAAGETAPADDQREVAKTLLQLVESMERMSTGFPGRRHFSPDDVETIKH